jgi:hypothetical protein
MERGMFWNMMHIAEALKAYSLEYGEYPSSSLGSEAALEMLPKGQFILEPWHVHAISWQYWYANVPHVKEVMPSAVILVERITLASESQVMIIAVTAEGEVLSLNSEVMEPSQLLVLKKKDVLEHYPGAQVVQLR